MIDGKSHITGANPKTNRFFETAERAERKGKLIHHLRCVAFYASLEHADTAGLAERSRIARLVERCDEALRKLLNDQKRRAA